MFWERTRVMHGATRPAEGMHFSTNACAFVMNESWLRGAATLRDDVFAFVCRFCFSFCVARKGASQLDKSDPPRRVRIKVEPSRGGLLLSSNLVSTRRTRRSDVRRDGSASRVSKLRKPGV